MTDTFLAPGPTGTGEPLPLSFTQERIWFEEQLRPGGTAYHMPVISRVTGPLDLPALEQALDTVVGRHAALRTVFTEVDGAAVQQVQDGTRVPVAHEDVRGLPDPEAAALLAARREAERPFDLAHGPLLRTLAVRTGDQDHLLVLTVHHLVFDGWSLGLFFEELSQAYGAARAGTAPALRPPRRHFTDAVREEREQLTPAVVDGLLDWWRGYLSGTPTVLELPADRPRTAVRSHGGSQRRLHLDAGLSAGVRALGRAHETTLYMTVLAAFGVVLARQSGRERLLVGSPVSTRRAGDRRTLGCFLNTLPVRLDLAGDPTFGDLLGRVRHSALEAFAHQRVPFQQLVGAVAPDRDLGRTQLVQVFFNVLPPTAALVLDGCTVEQLPFPEIDNKFDLTLYVSAEDDGLALEAVYDAGLYEPERIADLLEQVAQVLRQAVADPDRRLADLALVTPRAAALAPAATAELTAGYPGSVLERLAEHARRRPGRTALTGPSGSWTYGELADQVERLAGRLAESGVGTGDLVAVHATRDPAVVVALFAVWRAGASFALFDADHPRAELDLRAAELLPKAWIGTVPGADLPGPVLTVADAGAPPPPAPRPAASDPAYVVFTSGTTGRPRRIIGGHGPLAHFLDWYTGTFGIGEDDRFSVLSGLGHDPFLRDVLAPLWAGATAVFPDTDVRDTAALAESLRRQDITVAHLTPALADALAACAGPGWPALRLVGFGGDVLVHRTVREWAALAPAADLLNLYGATETPQAVSVHHVRRAGEAAPAGEGPVPLGPGIDEVQLLVLAGERLAGLGEVGELVVRTPHLARYADPEPQGGFGVNPLTGGHRDPVYRTGDLARLRPDGLVDYLGRADHQVKVRGFRVEPAEIEAVLAGQPGVRQAVVLAQPEERGGHRLVAYLATGGERPDLGRVRAALAAHLPDYKVPSGYVVLDAFPLTANRKVDRTALRLLGREEAAVEEYVAPAGTVEEQLAEVWREVLGRERIGSRDDFFALGGHSLLLGRVLVRIRRRLGVELTLRELFTHPTVARLARLVERSSAASAEEAVPRTDPSVPAPLSWTQERLWLEEQLRPGDAAYNMPLVLRVRGRLDPDALQCAVDAVVRRHAVLRNRFTVVDGVPVQYARDAVEVPVRRMELDPGAALAEAMRETKRPFDLGTGPLLRVLAVRTGEDEHVLVLTVHHIVFDGWSFGVLLDDLSRAYRAACEGSDPDLGDGLHFADVARWQRATSDGEPLAALLAWWKEHLSDVPTVLRLPTDRPRRAVQAHHGARHRLVVDPDTADRLRRLARDHNSTLYMALLTAFGTVLSRYSGQERLLVGTPVANRERAEFEDMVGCFLNTVPLRLDLRGAPAFGALLRRVTDDALAAFTHQGVPFGKLVGEVSPERDLSHSPLVQVLFALQTVRLGSFEAPGVTSELVEVSEANAQFDLNLRMLDTGGEIIGWLDYDTDLFDAETVERFAGHFTTLLGAVAADPAVPAATAELLGAAEHQRLVSGWNATAADWPLDRTLTSLLAEQATPSAGRIAVRCAGRELTYAELHARAGRLAWLLREHGVGPDVVVGVRMERSVELMVALLAVHKAGGAYLPLDPGYPRDRLEFMLADSRVPVLLTDAGAPGGTDPAPRNGGDGGDGPTVIRVRPDTAADRPGSAPEPLAGPDHLAYVIYTSGSTGRPKGVQVPHRGIVNRLLWMQDAYRLGAGDTVLQKTPISFDVSVWELFWPLMSGARVVLAEPGGHRDPGYLAQLIRDEKVTVCHFVPPMLETFLTAAPAETCDSLRLVACSGEALPAELARRFHRTLPDARLENLYGPTEASVDVTRWSSRPDWDRPDVPIGAPIANTRVYVLDRWMAPAPIGVPGELYLGGVQLARAYGDRPGLTADRFVPDPFGEPGRRLYRTGDLARWRPDGTVEYLGRIDHQVKVRGFRIELGEIEAALAGQAGVGHAVVVVREDEPGDRRIVAYLTPSGDAAPDRTALRSALARALPDYMVPSAFVLLDALPLSPNGKVDRRALPAPERDRPDAGYTAPRTERERQFAEIWQRVLRLDRVGVTDNFFELGGDSMHAVRVVGQARELGWDIPLSELFTHQTVEAVMAWLGSRAEAVVEQAPRQVAAFGLLSPEDLARLRAK